MMPLIEHLSLRSCIPIFVRSATRMLRVDAFEPFEEQELRRELLTPCLVALPNAERLLGRDGGIVVHRSSLFQKHTSSADGDATTIAIAALGFFHAHAALAGL
jgi:hypothetical protein